jgi:spore coat protein U-like protein
MNNSLKTLSIIIFIILLCNASTVYALCSVSTTPVSFGSYDVFTAGPLDATGTITVDCNEAPPPTVIVSIGQSTNSGGFDPRAMKLTTGNELILYNLYIDSNRSNIWGDGTGNTMTIQPRVFKNRPLTSTVYGRIPPLQDVKAGNYSETVTVTITW